jgi:hypothetical protein
MIIGITSGIVVADGLLLETKIQINSYLLSALNLLKIKEIEKLSIFINSFLHNLFFFAIIISVSFTRIGFIFVLLLDFLKGLFIGFTLFFLTNTFKLMSLMGLIACVIFPFIILTASFVKISELGIKKSVDKLFKRFKNKMISTDEEINKEYSKKLSMILLFILFGVLLETFFVPKIIEIF